MIRIVKRSIRKLIPRTVRAQLKNLYILAFKYNQLKTIKNWECVDKNGEPIPWFTYPAVEYLSTLEFSEKNVFEYGGGYSTLFWAGRAKLIISVENDYNWYIKIKSMIKENERVKLLFRDQKDSYVNSILEEPIIFDIVVIDGRWRGDCVKVIGEKVNKKEGFMIILDNSDWYPKTAKFLREEFDMIQVDFHGFGPINGYTWTTSIFFSRNFQIKFKKEQLYSIGAIKQLAEDDIS
jgi:hypothetical protein